MKTTRPQNILILTSTYPRWRNDSTSPFVAHFAERLTIKGHGVTVLAPHAAGAKTYEILPEDVRVKRFRYSWPARTQTLAYGGGAVAKIQKTPSYALRLVSLVVSFSLNTLWLVFRKRINVINAHWLIPQGFIAVLCGLVVRKPVVVTVHGGDMFSLNDKLFTAFKRFTLKRATRVVVNSSATLEACRQLHDRQYELIPMGIEMEHFKPGEPSGVLQKRYGLGKFTILFVGRLSKEKGVEYLVKACKILKDSGTDYTCLIVGDGPLRGSLEQTVADDNLSKHVKFTGWVNVEEIKDYYNTADVLVGPSLNEALGLVFVESLACGLPVVATNVGGIKDVVEDGKTGYLVEPKSADALHEKLKYLYDHPEVRERLSVEGRKHVESKFSWESVIQRYDSVFDEAVASK